MRKLIALAALVAGALAASGMAPRGMDKPEQIMVAILAGAELGLAEVQPADALGDRLARIEQAPAQVREDFEKLLKWFGVKGDEQVVAMLRERLPEALEQLKRIACGENIRNSQDILAAIKVLLEAQAPAPAPARRRSWRRRKR